jgi:glucose/arabinose dehydrogenase
VVEKRGTVRVLKDGALLPTLYLDIRDRVGSQSSEQGLLGLAFHPRHAENGALFVNYTDVNGDTVIARFQVSEDTNQVDPNSETRLLQVRQPFRNHNGGAVVFGPDGMLYLGLGDGGSAGDPEGNGQSLDTHLGKILRLDVDGEEPYAIPADNPYASGGGLPEIWAYGLRNPWRIAFDRATGALYIADVGQNAWEEIDYQPAGAPGGVNYGWDYLEGTHPYEGSPPPDLELAPPVAEYSHDQGCSVSGGEVYRGDRLPEWAGIYLYGDYCSGLVWGLFRVESGGWESRRLFETGFTISSFGQDENGEVYLVDYSGGVYRLEGR